MVYFDSRQQRTFDRRLHGTFDPWVQGIIISTLGCSVLSTLGCTVYFNKMFKSRLHCIFRHVFSTLGCTVHSTLSLSPISMSCLCGGLRPSRFASRARVHLSALGCWRPAIAGRYVCFSWVSRVKVRPRRLGYRGGTRCAASPLCRRPAFSAWATKSTP